MKKLGDNIRKELRYAKECNTLDRYYMFALCLCLAPIHILMIEGQIGILFGMFFMLAGLVTLIEANLQMMYCKLTEVIDEMNDKEQRLRELQEQVEALQGAMIRA